MAEEVPQIVVIWLVNKPECLDVSQIGSELSVNVCTEFSSADLLLCSHIQ